jgi:hypothetical protein
MEGIDTRRLAHAMVRLDTAVNLAHMSRATDKCDYVIFNNGLTTSFDVWEGEGRVEALIKDDYMRGFVHAYRLRGEDKVFRKPVYNEKTGYIEWIDVGNT